MEFGELPPQIMDAFMRILNNHLDVAEINLENDKVLFPLLVFVNRDFSMGQVVPLQPPMTTAINSETSLDAAVQILNTTYFEKALFSCSTKIKSDSGVVDAIKTVLFDGSGICATFFTPYHYKGIFNKKIAYSKNIFDGIRTDLLRRGNAGGQGGQGHG